MANYVAAVPLLLLAGTHVTAKRLAADSVISNEDGVALSRRKVGLSVRALQEDDSQLDPLQIFAPSGPEVQSKVYEWCAAEIAEHYLTLFTGLDVDKNRSVICSTDVTDGGVLSIWDAPSMLEFYFGVPKEKAERAISNNGNLSTGTLLGDVAHCCEDEAWECCGRCAAMVSWDTVHDALEEVRGAQRRVCSAGAVLKAEGTWSEVVSLARRAKWDAETEHGGSCIDPETCETNRLSRGKKWCYTSGTWSSLSNLGGVFSRAFGSPWDYCMPSVRYMCATRGLHCTGEVGELQCAVADDIDSCEALAGCAFKAFACVPRAFELEGVLEQTGGGLAAEPGASLLPAPREAWRRYYSSQLDSLLAQVAAGQKQHSDLIALCSRLPWPYCEEPCTRHGFGASLLFGQLTPFQTTFGYCSLHGHYEAQALTPWRSSSANALVETMMHGTMELGLKFANMYTLTFCIMVFDAFFGGSLIPPVFDAWFSQLFGAGIAVGHAALNAIFTTVIPADIVHTEAFYAVINAPIVEEVIFRGLLRGAVRDVADSAVRGVIDLVEKLGLFGGKLKDREVLERYAFIVTQLTTAFAFGYIHAFNAHSGATMQAIFCFWNGITMQIVHQKYGIAYTTLAHFINNGLATGLQAIGR